jgi:hypothetical protein
MPHINASAEIPSPLKQLMRERIETYVSMYSLASASTKTRTGFEKAIDARKSANSAKVRAFKDSYDKFLDDLERKTPVKAK